MKLVIVESPAKCNTIGKYLGQDYKVMASYGHIRDLSTRGKGGLGVDLTNDFKADYVNDPKKATQIKELINNAKNADEVILATDPDREGEAIAWHLAMVLGLDVETTKRLEFHEITKGAIEEAINNPRTINMDLVNSQECRRILDRIVGFELTKVLKKKIRTESAGRVQSATLKLIVDHEKEIRAFIPTDYWTIDGTVKNDDHNLEVKLDKINGATAKLENEEYANQIFNSLKDEYIVSSVNKEVKSRASKAPFTTSTMQQEAFSKYKFTTKKTSLIAQGLYEGKEVNGEFVGLITYMRTDSVRLSPQFVASATDYIKERFGENYLGVLANRAKKGQVQDAHEAIRPTSILRTPEVVKPFLSKDEYNLYRLIYNRAVASLMAPNQYEITTVLLNNGDCQFKSTAEKSIFPGYCALYKDSESEEEDALIKDGVIENINVGDVFTKEEVTLNKHTTEPPSRYTEGKVVKLMEELGIGRPSTYAATISLLLKRAYVKSEKNLLVAQNSGMLTIDYLDNNFSDIVNANFTAEMEESLDDITKQNKTRVGVLTKFTNYFFPRIEKAQESEYQLPAEYVEQIGTCPDCGSPLVKKKGKYGEFVACSNYPTCKYIQKKEKPVAEESGNICPECGAPLVYRVNKKGDKFEACSNFPKCRYIAGAEKRKEDLVVIKECPDCGGNLLLRTSKRGQFLGCSNYPKCKHLEKYEPKKE